MLRPRLLTAAVGLPILILLVCCAPFWLFAGALLLLTVFGLHEYYCLVEPLLTLPRLLGVVWGGLVALAMLTKSLAIVMAVFSGGFFLVFSLSLLNSNPRQSLVGFSLLLLGVFYIGFLLPHLVWVRQQPAGTAWLFFLLFVVMLGDTSAYLVGSQWGKRKLIPHISPGKTVEGSVGAMGGHLLAAVGSWWWLLPERSFGELALLALGVGLLAQLGDLCESALKRACGVKDSGALFPGHGGVLDRVDSLLFPAAFIYYYVILYR